jgi:pimeloyl-ACP methyl ester carboxylesterase
MSIVVLEQEMVHYEVLGRGRPIIFLHGWVGSWRYWIPAMQAVSISYRAYALDFWGFGDTAKAKDRYNLSEQVRLVDMFMEQMGIMRVALVGHGLGAVVALSYANEHPEFVDRIMAVNYPLDETTINPRLKSSSQVELLDWLVGKTPQTEPVRLEAPKTDMLAIQNSIEGLPGAKLVETWHHLSTSCLLVHGQTDPLIPEMKLEEEVEMPQQMHSISFDLSGHFPMIDENNKFNRLLLDFLGLPSGESPRQLSLKEEWKRRVR